MDEYGICRNCENAPAVAYWVAEGSMMDFVHGGGVPWCERCCVVAKLKYARQQLAELPGRIAELEANLEAIDGAKS